MSKGSRVRKSAFSSKFILVNILFLVLLVGIVSVALNSSGLDFFTVFAGGEGYDIEPNAGFGGILLNSVYDTSLVINGQTFNLGFGKCENGVCTDFNPSVYSKCVLLSGIGPGQCASYNWVLKADTGYGLPVSAAGTVWCSKDRADGTRVDPKSSSCGSAVQSCDSSVIGSCSPWICTGYDKMGVSADIIDSSNCEHICEYRVLNERNSPSCGYVAPAPSCVDRAPSFSEMKVSFATVFSSVSEDLRSVSPGSVVWVSVGAENVGFCQSGKFILDAFVVPASWGNAIPSQNPFLSIISEPESTKGCDAWSQGVTQVVTVGSGAWDTKRFEMVVPKVGDVLKSTDCAVANTYLGQSSYSTDMVLSVTLYDASTLARLSGSNYRFKVTGAVCGSGSLSSCTESSCVSAGLFWYGGACHTSAEIPVSDAGEDVSVCSASNLAACDTELKCNSAGLYYYNTVLYKGCFAERKCSSAGLDVGLCTSGECSTLGAYWYDGSCHVTQQTVLTGDILVKSITAPSTFTPGELYDFSVQADESGLVSASGIIEGCIYPAKWGPALGFSFLATTSVDALSLACNEFCQRKEVTLTPGVGEASVAFQVRAPTNVSYDTCGNGGTLPDGGLAWDSSGNFKVVVMAYKLEGGEYVRTDSKVVSVSPVSAGAVGGVVTVGGVCAGFSGSSSVTVCKDDASSVTYLCKDGVEVNSLVKSCGVDETCRDIVSGPFEYATSYDVAGKAVALNVRYEGICSATSLSAPTISILQNNIDKLDFANGFTGDKLTVIVPFKHDSQEYGSVRAAVCISTNPKASTVITAKLHTFFRNAVDSLKGFLSDLVNTATGSNNVFQSFFPQSIVTYQEVYPQTPEGTVICGITHFVAEPEETGSVPVVLRVPCVDASSDTADVFVILQKDGEMGSQVSFEDGVRITNYLGRFDASKCYLKSYEVWSFDRVKADCFQRGSGLGKCFGAVSGWVWGGLGDFGHELPLGVKKAFTGIVGIVLLLIFLPIIIQILGVVLRFGKL